MTKIRRLVMLLVGVTLLTIAYALAHFLLGWWWLACTPFFLLGTALLGMALAPWSDES